MIDHLSIPTTKYDETIAFYDACLKAIGAERCVNMTAHWNPDWPEQRLCAYGVGGKPVFWIGEAKSSEGTRHIAFTADGVDAVKGFYDAGLATGGSCNGVPGPREIYHPGYYGGFLIDPNGNNVEAVFHAFSG